MKNEQYYQNSQGKLNKGKSSYFSDATKRRKVYFSAATKTKVCVQKFGRKSCRMTPKK